LRHRTTFLTQAAFSPTKKFSGKISSLSKEEFRKVDSMTWFRASKSFIKKESMRGITIA
jgi:hypothetical protein